MRCDDPIEPAQPVTRKAFRFRLAVVNPLNAIGAAGPPPRSHGLPGAQVVAVMNGGLGRELIRANLETLNVPVVDKEENGTARPNALTEAV